VVSGAPAASYRNLLTGPYRALVLGALGATFIASLDVLMVAPALPSAARDVGGIHLYALVVGIYSVTMTAGLPLGGALNDRRGGVWTTLLLGAGFFTVGSLIGATAGEMWIVALGRALQGFGGGLLFSVPLAAIMYNLPPTLHRHALALNAATWSASALIGPPLGSLLTEVASWRLVFLVSLPPLVLSLLLAWQGLRGRTPAPHAPERFNVIGPALLALVVLCLLVLPLATPLPAIAFALYERRAAQPVFPRTRAARAVCVLSAAAGIAFVGAEAFVQLDLQAGVGWSVIEAAVPLITSTMAWTVGSMAMARLNLAPRTMIAIGTTLAAIGCALMALPTDGGLAVAVGLTIAALGMGVQSPGMFLAIVEGIGGEAGRATASVTVARTIGGGVGIALAGAVVAAVAGSAALDAAEAGALAVPEVHEGARMAYLVAAGTCAVVLPVALALRRRSAAPA
jgi:MFS family permease